MHSDEQLFQEFPISGPDQWKEHLNVDVSRLEVPQSLLQKMKEDCPFWPGRKVKETHMLFFIPKT